TDRLLAVYIFRIGKKLIGNSGFAHNIITVTVPDNLNLSLQVQLLKTFDLPIMAGKHVFFIKTNDKSILIKFEGIGVNPARRDIVFLYNRVDKLLKTTGNHINIV